MEETEELELIRNMEELERKCQYIFARVKNNECLHRILTSNKIILEDYSATKSLTIEQVCPKG